MRAMCTSVKLCQVASYKPRTHPTFVHLAGRLCQTRDVRTQLRSPRPLSLEVPQWPLAPPAQHHPHPQLCQQGRCPPPAKTVGARICSHRTSCTCERLIRCAANGNMAHAEELFEEELFCPSDAVDWLVRVVTDGADRV